MTQRMPFGKYKFQSFKEIQDIDEQYLYWIYGEMKKAGGLNKWDRNHKLCKSLDDFLGIERERILHDSSITNFQRPNLESIQAKVNENPNNKTG